MVLEILCLIEFFIVILLFVLIWYQETKHKKRLELEEIRVLSKNKKLEIYERDLKIQIELINDYEKQLFEENDTIKTCTGTIVKENTYQGKTALIGDYSPATYKHTKIILQSLGMTVKIANSIDDVIQRASSGITYDVIFTNNIYRHGEGIDCLRKLRSIKGFDTPVVMTTVTKNAREHFLGLGFDEYITKPLKQEDAKVVLENIFSKK